MTNAVTLEPPVAGHRSGLRYLVVGLVSFAVDYGVLALGYNALHLPLWLSASAGFWVSFVVNFVLSRRWTFNAVAGAPGGQLVRYSVLVAFNYGCTVVAVPALHHAGLTLLVAKAITVGALTVWTFAVYRLWVFAR